MKRYVSQGRNGYGAIDEYEDGKCMRTTMVGIKPAKLADEIAAHLNAAFEDGRDAALGGASLAILSSIAARPSHYPAALIREQVGLVVAGSR